MEKIDKEFMLIALREGRKSLQDGLLPVGAVVVQDGRVVLGTGRKEKGKNTFLEHAEIGALKAALGDEAEGPSVTIYTTLEPCLMCFAAILNSRRVKRTVYALEDPYGGGCSLPQKILTPRYQEWWPEIEAGVAEEEAKEIFREFFATTEDPYWANEDNPLRVAIEKN